MINESDKSNSDWENDLDRLSEFFGLEETESEEKVESVINERLIWLLNPETVSLTAMEQQRKKDGTWSKGRIISLWRLFYDSDNQDFTFLTEQDHEILKHLKRDLNTHSLGENYSYGADFLLDLVGHPHLYHLENPDLQLELIPARPEMVIKQDGDKYQIKLSHHADDKNKVFLEKETLSRYRVVCFPDEFFGLQKIIGKDGLTVPLSVRDKLINLIQKASNKIDINSDISARSAQTIPADSRPCIILEPYNEGLKLSILVRPFANLGPHMQVGKGSQLILANIKGEDKQAQRNLEREIIRAEAFIEACTVLNNYAAKSNEYHILKEEDCLELLLEIKKYREKFQDEIKIEWPKGEKFQVKDEVGFDLLSLQINKKNSWLECSGELKFGMEESLNIQSLLRLMDDSDSRFIKLKDGQFLALTEHFRKQMEKLRSLRDRNSTSTRIHQLSALLLEDLIDELDGMKHCQIDSSWREYFNKFKNINRYKPQVPSTLKAELRDYQEDGFRWISRLAKLGLGACLADDMGLGKTVQTIAVMLQQSRQGKCLVVAPTSVCHNWAAEINRFAPSLNPILFAELDDRKSVFMSLNKRDVLITSYGLLQSNLESFTEGKWQMIVLDEAHAIKNHSTKRTQAVMQLDAHFKLTLTGTPIENNIGDLWTQFNFTNPGLLGARDSFFDKFGIASYEGSEDENENQEYILKQAKEKRKLLQSLIKPFILRRSKNKVLDELPPKIEKNILLEADRKEAAFYEAIRRQALENLEDLDKGKQSQRKFRIFQEISRLRKACCHPELVNLELAQSLKLSSAKIEAFKTLVRDLIAGGHKALVFSQYVGFLKIAAKELDKMKLNYQYLDGSTPASMRKNKVEEFQSGVGDLFLISLKAGGSGLNLTEADYVIHLDPWWNPAVEDQASDRAYRIGQTRSVTVYRFIMQGTIEEKIVKMHQTKRKLAADLLSGADGQTKLSEAELIGLLQ